MQCSQLDWQIPAMAITQPKTIERNIHTNGTKINAGSPVSLDSHSWSRHQIAPWRRVSMITHIHTKNLRDHKHLPYEAHASVWFIAQWSTVFAKSKACEFSHFKSHTKQPNAIAGKQCECDSHAVEIRKPKWDEDQTIFLINYKSNNSNNNRKWIRMKKRNKTTATETVATN